MKANPRLGLALRDIPPGLTAALADRYAFQRELGRGGMAIVYLAQDLKHDRLVAIKVLRPELAASLSLGADRFLREIKVAAHLHHPHILPLYDSGEGGGFLYYVMPFVEGESLRTRLDREEQLPITEAVQLTCEVADALHHAHTHGVIHRDIKPENILIQEGHALVADFGIARAVTEAGGENLTETGMAVGTPHYMSPEQAHGGNHIDGRSDLYSLACVLYEMLVGQPPFQGSNASAILARHSLDPVPSLRVVRHAVSDELEAAVIRALEKIPADRFPTLPDFAATLAKTDPAHTYGRASPPAGHRVRRTTPSAGPERRHKTRLVLLLLIVVVLAGVAWIWVALHNRTGKTAAAASTGLDPRRIAVLYLEEKAPEDSARYLADGLTEGLISELDQVPGLDVISAGGVAPYRGNKVPPDSMAKALRAGMLVTGMVERKGQRLRVAMRLVDGASGADLERASFEQPAGNVLAAQDTLTHTVARLIRARLGEEIRLREQRSKTRNEEAWILFQRAGRHHKNAEVAAKRGDTLSVLREFEAADSLLANAQKLDQRWTEPVLARALLAYRQSRLAPNDPAKAGKWIKQGLDYAEHALRLAPDDPTGLELRGSLRYWRWLLALAPDPVEARMLLKAAQQDLETAVKFAPSQAGAWATLSHLYYQTKDFLDVKLAARRAYEEDAYLSNADVILSRLFYASYDLEQFSEAEHWCKEGATRFPEDPRFVECELHLLNSKAREPDVNRAWELSRIMVGKAHQDREFQRLQSELLVAAVLARAGLKDSARNLAKRSEGRAEIDPTRDLMYFASKVYKLLGNREDEIRVLKTYVAANPERRTEFEERLRELSEK